MKLTAPAVCKTVKFHNQIILIIFLYSFKINVIKGDTFFPNSWQLQNFNLEFINCAQSLFIRIKSKKYGTMFKLNCWSETVNSDNIQKNIDYNKLWLHLSHILKRKNKCKTLKLRLIPKENDRTPICCKFSCTWKLKTLKINDTLKHVELVKWGVLLFWKMKSYQHSFSLCRS